MAVMVETTTMSASLVVLELLWPVVCIVHVIVHIVEAENRAVDVPICLGLYVVTMEKHIPINARLDVLE